MKVPTVYDPLITPASLLPAVLLATAGFSVAAMGAPYAFAGGGIVGMSIGSMHYPGMRAVNVPGTFDRNASTAHTSLHKK